MVCNCFNISAAYFLFSQQFLTSHSPVTIISCTRGLPWWKSMENYVFFKLANIHIILGFSRLSILASKRKINNALHIFTNALTILYEQNGGKCAAQLLYMWFVILHHLRTSFLFTCIVLFHL